MDFIRHHSLSHPQKRIWYMEKMYPNTSMYNIGGLVKIHGPVNTVLLSEAIKTSIRLNDGLRLQFYEGQGEARQFIRENEDYSIPFIDFSHHASPITVLDSWACTLFSTPFDLINQSLYHFAIFKLSDNLNGYFVKLHHIIADGWSISLLTSQIGEIYTKLIHGESEPTEPCESYLEYLEAERSFFASKRFEKSKKYWNDKFRSLPESFLIKSSDHLHGKRKIMNLDETMSGKLAQFAARNNISLGSLFILLTLIYQSKLTRNKDQILGVPLHNRSDLKNVIGMFTSTMPIRIELGDTMTLEDLLKRVKQEKLESFRYQKYPYDMLVRDIELKKQGYDNLFQICVNDYGTKLPSTINGCRIENEELYSGYQAYSLQIGIKQWSESDLITLFFDYKLCDYTEEKIDELYSRFIHLFEQLMTGGDGLPIQSLSLLTDEEAQEHIFDRNQTDELYPCNETVHQLFEQQVQSTPERIAVRFKNEAYTYRDFNERANQLARRLRLDGIRPNEIIAIMANHSYDVLVGIFAVLKAGGAYLPIDPSYPPERVSFILENSQTQLLLTNFAVALPEFTGEVLRLDEPSIYAGESGNLNNVNSPRDIVYTIYTSGSTGRPKGTLIEHQGLINYVYWAKSAYIQNREETFALYSSLAFDLTVTSIFVPLLSGNTIVVYQDDGAEFVLHSILRDNRTSVLKLTPAHLALLKDMDNRNTSVKRLIVGGEDLKAALAASVYKSFGHNITIYNEYGPTETVVGCMIYKYQPEVEQEGSVPIGRPISNVQIYILNDDLHPVPDGVAGELYISGDGVAKGYLNRPELTAEKFVDNPFILGKRMYRTGDLARYTPSGDIEYLGRIDHQVKIKGYRIELGEIESELLRHLAVKEAVVVDHCEDNGYQFLCAYVIIQNDNFVGRETLVGNDSQFDVANLAAELRRHLLERLPSYMIPANFVTMTEFPLTPNGKIDRGKLPSPLLNRSEEHENETANTEVEAILIDLVKELLQINKVDPYDNFYQLGGDSIKAIGLTTKLNQYGLHLSVRDVLSYPVIRELASAIDVNNSSQHSVIPQSPLEGFIKPMPITSWFFSQHFPDPHHWNQSILLKIKKNFSNEQLLTAINYLICHHDALRLNVDQDTGLLFYNMNHLIGHAILETYDLSTYEAERQIEELLTISERVKASFDLKKGLLFKGILFEMGTGTRRLLLTAHHLVVDGVSWRILLEDFIQLLQEMEEGKTLSLPAKTHSISDWAEEISSYSQERALTYLPYWQNVAGYRIKETSLNNDNALIADCETVQIDLSVEETEKLLREANQAYLTQTHELLIIALSLTIANLENSSDVRIELEGHGRENLLHEIDLTRTVGWFTTMYPLNLNVPIGDVGSCIKRIKEQIREVPNKGIDYGILKFLSSHFEGIQEDCVRFNYLGELIEQLDNEYFSLASEKTGSEISLKNTLTCLVDIVAIIQHKQLVVSMNYSLNQFTKDEMEHFKTNFLLHIRQIISHCCQTNQIQAFTPSDFEAVEISQSDLDSLFD